MTYTDAVKSGLGLVNRNWQLVVVQAGMMLVNCIGFFVIVGIPLFIAFVVFGLDLTGLASTRDIIGLLRQPSELISKYMGLVLIVVVSFLLYLLIVTSIGLFVFAGAIGSVGHAVIDTSRKFSLKLFFAEAKKVFFPLMWFSLFMGLVFIAITFCLGLLGGGVAAIVQSAKSQDSTLALFLGIFFSLVLALFGVIVVLGAIAVTVYGLAVLFFKNEGAVRSCKDAAIFLWQRQAAFWLYVMLFFAYVIASFILMLFTYPFNLIPIIGTIISFPLQLASYVVQSYIGLAIIATVFNYYYEAEIRKAGSSAGPAETEGAAKAVDEGSSGPEDISGAGDPQPGETPPEKVPTEEA